MIEVKTINCSNKPKEIHANKWLKLGEVVHVNYVTRLLPQDVLGFSIYEHPLDESCMPYEYFLSTRFAISKENVKRIIEMFNDIANVSDEELQQILKNSNLEQV